MFVRQTAAEYRGDSRIAGIDAPYGKMVTALGEPHKSDDADYPDDGYKTDVCWSVRSAENPAYIVTFWNYKNGPNYNDGEGAIEEIDHFSVFYTNAEFYERVKALIEAT